MKPTVLLALRAFAVAPLALALLTAPAVASAQDASKPAAAPAKPPKKKLPKEQPKEEPKPEPPPPAAEPAPAVTTAPATEPAAASNVEPPKEVWDIKDVEENPMKTYYFVGLRYRGNVIPKFLLNMFVEEGGTIYSNSVGIELDIRRNNFSLIPALQYTEYGTGDLLFKQKNTSDIPGNYALVNSSLKSIYAMADLLWSANISKNVQFEYGAGFGVGVLFGNLENNWVQESPNGLRADNGKHYIACPVVGPPGTGCNKVDHQNSSTDKVGGYVEKSWFDGGSRPVLFPWIALPQLGLRIKPIKQFVGRIGLGFSLTGFWFGFNGEYGLEQKPKALQKEY